jgi:hypothetical protein
MRSLLTTTLIGSLLTISSLAQAELAANVGFTGYYYTGDFDGPTQGYTYYALTVENKGFYGKYEAVVFTVAKSFDIQ